ncbi:26S protease regulatory subunit 8 homolog A [Tanacetum coccineum]
MLWTKVHSLALNSIALREFVTGYGCRNLLCSRLFNFQSNIPSYLRVWGVLLYGPPGTGKTLLARAVAHHTDCTFIRVSSSELVQKYLGEGSRMVRELFVMAREHAPSIIFMDEIDSIGSARMESGSGGGDSEVQRTMLELLNQLDGFEASNKIKEELIGRLNSQILTKINRFSSGGYQQQMSFHDNIGVSERSVAGAEALLAKLAQDRESASLIDEITVMHNAAYITHLLVSYVCLSVLSEFYDTNQALEDYSGNEGPASHSVCIQTYSLNTVESLGGKKPVGSLEDFSEAYINFCRKLFYSCMQVVWNDVLYDPVAEHLPLLSSIM